MRIHSYKVKTKFWRTKTNEIILRLSPCGPRHTLKKIRKNLEHRFLIGDPWIPWGSVDNYSGSTM